MNHLRALFSYFDVKYKPTEETFDHIETALLPHILRIWKQDNTLWTEVEIVPGVKLTWTDAKSEQGWSYVNTALLHSLLHGDPKEKFKTLFTAAKELVPGLGPKADEFEAILDNEETKGSLEEMLELLMTTRFVGIIGDIAKEVDFESIGLKIDDMDTLLEIMKAPMEHPAVKVLLTRVQTIIESKVKHGKINVVELRAELETLRAKFQSSFGRYVNTAFFGGNTTGNTAAEIVSNHPDARRARMLARLKRKQQDKNRTQE